MKPGTLYAVIGEADWIYYGQIAPDQKVGFLRRRDRDLAEVEAVLASPVMTVISVAFASVTRALRAGFWKRLGRFSVLDALAAPRSTVQWPAGTLSVTVWTDDVASRETRVDDPAIQDMELMSVWDAQHHIPARLTAEFGEEPAAWHVGGPIRRERQIKEEMAVRFPDEPGHRLHADWVPTSVR